MVEQSIVACSKCGTDLFYISSKYKMSTKVVCMACGAKKGKRKRRKKTSIQSAASNYSRCRRGIRKDVHDTYCFRSASEANIARMFIYLGFDWTFEEDLFTFDRWDSSTGKGYKTPPYGYLMDFRVKKAPKRLQKKLGLDLPVGLYEMKGYMTAKNRNKMRRFKKNYPDAAAKTIMILSSKKDVEFCEKVGYTYVMYQDLAKTFKEVIPTWE